MDNLTEEQRRDFVDQVLEELDEVEEEEETVIENEESPEETSEMPKDLSTPVSLTQQNRQAAEQQKKKKKKKKSKSKLPEAGSELPDDYVEKYQEDLIDNPFDPTLPLSQRVEYAIWKYRRNHKFTEEKNEIFANYLKFGGIITGQNMFLGGTTAADVDEDGEMDFKAAKLAIDTVPDELEEGVEVSFSEVAQVYLGNTFIRENRFIAMQNFIDTPNIIDAFLRYLQIRNVAPEYADDIAKARAIVSQAKVELPKCKKLSVDMPGKLNRACAIVFGDESISMDMSWMKDASAKTMKMFSEFLDEAVGMTTEEATNIVRSQMGDIKGVHVLKTLSFVLAKVTSIPPIPADAQPDAFFKVTFTNYDDNKESYDIIFEKKIIDNLVLGMVARVTLCKLSNGEWYLEKATRIMPSFYMEDDCLSEDYDY
ncbi:hypothetical protein BCV72DRAFT_83581 [Rhizopus microsporus var. microsporus]|uniref:Uncharacterized protein n=2 Tax=Rhizopus microsporus TaxID=58291 RepID=A0A2G4SR31_RHIZD|nr:uncharacterized protein RHIMIDRAFT_238668 [Rhizopus microsporus ATCC 52813]ORE01155.1 hypothetical protein BCV72DRAFT_83581 [Rhizopus microsporus var. microsporus]PHZ11229.1 hypothetical protein RHIMIDRAFT_238668 [Rhizopus microsporus ATCC 52813]